MAAGCVCCLLPAACYISSLNPGASTPRCGNYPRPKPHPNKTMIMRLSLATPALCLFLAAPLWAQSTAAITGVSVIPMTRDTVLRDMTIVVQDGRIRALGPSRTTQVPAGARRVDGRGRFVLPGLADMHTHLFADGPVPDSAGAAELGVIHANVVTVRWLLIGSPTHLRLL